MPAFLPQTLRLTASGACASCNAYGGSAHASSCNAAEPRKKFRRGHMPRAARNSRLSAVAVAQERLQRRLIRDL